jgi:hypothetical protein
MLRGQPLEGVPVHSLGLPAITVEDARFSSQLFTDSVSPSCCPVIIRFPLSGLGQAIAVPVGEDCTAVEDSNPPAAAVCRAEEPNVQHPG